MYIRFKTINGKRYYQVVESFRDGYRTRQRSLVSMGRNPIPKDAIRAYEKKIADCKQEISEIGTERRSSRLANRRCAELEGRISRLEEKIKVLKALPKDLLTVRHRTRPRHLTEPKR